MCYLHSLIQRHLWRGRFFWTNAAASINQPLYRKSSDVRRISQNKSSKHNSVAAFKYLLEATNTIHLLEGVLLFTNHAPSGVSYASR